MSKSNVKNIKTIKQFNRLMEKSYDHPVIIDYHATWCGPCKKIAPIFYDLSDDSSVKESQMIFARIDVDDLDTLTDKQHIMSMPTFVVYKDGVQAERVEGASTTRLTNMIFHHV
jgi:thioredoxin 1